MTVADDVTLDDLILAKDDLSGADIKVKSEAHWIQICLPVENRHMVLRIRTGLMGGTNG